MSDNEVKILAINLVKKLIDYSEINNLKVSFSTNGTLISSSKIFIAHYEDLIEDINNYTLYYKPINNFNLILTDEDDGLYPYHSTISFYTEDDDLRVKFIFKSDYYDIISYEKTSTTMERMLKLKSYYKTMNLKKDLYSEINYN